MAQTQCVYALLGRVSYSSPAKDAQYFFHYSLIYYFFHYSLIYDYFGKMNALKCILKLPAEFMKKGFNILTIFDMPHT